MTDLAASATPAARPRRGAGRIALRWGLYLLLCLFALYYLLPLFVMVTTSLKSLDEIRSGSLVALPRDITFEAWRTAWSGACTGIQCEGLRPYFWNSVLLAVPAVLISTVVGALNGYVVAQWRFRGANIIFSLMLFGCFIPFQVVLLPMARLLGLMGIAGTIPGLIFVHVIYGLGFTTLFFRNYYVTIPSELVKAAKVDGAGFFRIFWSIFLPLSLPIITVSVIWQFTQIWNDFLFGVSFSSAGTQPVTVALNNIVNSTTGVKAYNVDMAAAIIAGLPTLFVYVLAGKYFIRGLTALRSQALTAIDCPVALGFTGRQDTSGQRAAVVDVEGHLYALLVDEAYDVGEARSDPVGVPGGFGEGWQAAARGMVETDGGPTLLIEVEKLVTAPVAQVAA